MSTSSYKYTIGSTGNQKTLTLSGWFKTANLSDTAADGAFFSYYSTATNNPRSEVIVNNDSKIYVSINPTGTSWKTLIFPNRLRDPAAWYHLVFAYDTTQSVEADRVKVYVNGNQITPESGTYPSLNEDTGYFVSGETMNIGKDGASVYWNGNMAHVNIIDGTAYAPTAFGEFDSTSGIWVPKTGPSVTYGDEGGFYKFVAGALTTDSSGNSNTLTTVGTPTPTKDNPSNNFCTLEGGIITPNSSYDPVYTNGNTTVITSHTTSGHDWGGCSTTGLQAGLWYWEIYINNMTGDSIQGVYADPQKNATANTFLGNYAGDMGYVQAGQYITGGSATSWGNTYTAGDYIGCYLDLTANKMYFSKNGTIQESGVGLTITAPADLTGNSPNAYFPGCSAYTTGASTFDFNFGNGYFGTTAISGASADAGGEGAFKYNPSTGTFDSSSKDFRAICTNNIATYG